MFISEVTAQFSFASLVQNLFLFHCALLCFVVFMIDRGLTPAFVADRMNPGRALNLSRLGCPVCW